MKSETMSLLSKHQKSGKFQFISTDLGLELEHSLTDQEKMELVQCEYSPKGIRADYPCINVDELFVKIMRQVVKMAAQQAKIEVLDKLSEL